MDQNSPVKELLPKVSRNGVKIGIRYEGFKQLREDGLTIPQASKVLGITRQRGFQIEKTLDQKYDLTTPKHIKLAHLAHVKILKAFLEPDKVTTPCEVKTSDVNHCIDRSYDRYQPKVQRSINLNATLDIHPVDLSEFL